MYIRHLSSSTPNSLYPTLPYPTPHHHSVSILDFRMGISACTEFQRQQKFHQSHQLNAQKKMPREIQIPPRKLHRRHLAAAQTLYHNGGGATYIFMDSADQSFLSKKRLPYNDDDDEKNPFTSDYFRMYEFKVRISMSRAYLCLYIILKKYFAQSVV